MGIYRELKDVIYMNIPCNIYSPSDNLEQQSYYKLSLILDEYKRILKEANTNFLFSFKSRE